MDIAVIGTGVVGRALAARISALGHQVVVGTRDPHHTLARTDVDAMGTGPYAQWQAEHPGVGLATFAEAAAGAELVVNATLGSVTLDVLEHAGAANLAGKVLLDVSNPLDFSRGFPPTLTVKDTDSLAEQVQRAFPGVTVVKSLQTMSAHLMVDPTSLAGGDHSVFVCGDDAAAKATVTGLLVSFGWTDVIDLGPLSSARGTEMLLPVWLRLMSALGTANFQFKIVR